MGGRRDRQSIDKAHGSILVPLGHGVDALGQLCTTRLIDATSVDPRVLKTHLKSKAAGGLGDMWSLLGLFNVIGL